jgi:hypothetical protein
MAAVTADMIEGVVAANRLAGPPADRLRAELWAAVSASPQHRTPHLRSVPRRVA